MDASARALPRPACRCTVPVQARPPSPVCPPAQTERARPVQGTELPVPPVDDTKRKAAEKAERERKRKEREAVESEKLKAAPWMKAKKWADQVSRP